MTLNNSLTKANIAEFPAISFMITTRPGRDTPRMAGWNGAGELATNPPGDPANRVDLLLLCFGGGLAGKTTINSREYTKQRSSYSSLASNRGSVRQLADDHAFSQVRPPGGEPAKCPPGSPRPPQSSMILVGAR